MLFKEVSDRDTETVEQLDEAPVQEAVTESAASDHIECEITRAKLNLTLPKLDLAAA